MEFEYETGGGQPSLFNMKSGNHPKDAVYIGRPSKWGNPFSHKTGTLAAYKVRTRAEAIQAYADYVKDNPALQDEIRRELKGKDLVCWCHPAPCHGMILLNIANEETPESR